MKWSAQSADVAQTAALLARVFPGSPKFQDLAYLTWLYRDNPRGHAICVDAVADQRSYAHYGAIPQTLVRAAELLPVYLSVNSATAAELRGKGVFASLGLATYAQAEARVNPPAGFIGVPNRDALTPRVKRLNWRIVDTLALKIAICRPFGGPVGSVLRVTPAALAGSTFSQLCSDLDFSPICAGTNTWTQLWDEDYLRWRVSNPLGSYTIHTVPGLTGVATTAHPKGIKVAILGKIFSHKGAPTGDASALLSSIARHHQTPFVVYGGLNSSVQVPGWSVPARLRRSPLTMGICPRRPSPMDASDFRIDRFEFFDFDIL